MSSAADDLAIYAGTLSLGIAGVSIFSGVEPDAVVDPAVTFKGYGNELNVKTYENRRPTVTTPRVQVTARSRSFNAAAQIADELYDALFQSNVLINGNAYSMLEPMNEPMPFGPDATDRIQIGFNVRTRRLSS